MSELDDAWERAERPRPTTGPRFYGVDQSDAGEALCEVTIDDDGVQHHTFVWIPAPTTRPQAQ